MNETRLVEIETKLAYQEDTIQQLNDVVCLQHNQLEKLETLCKHLMDRLKELSEERTDGSSIEKPPHY
jgi:SlyX protein